MTVAIVSSLDREVLSSWDLEMPHSPCSDEHLSIKFALPPRRSVRFSADPVSECHAIDHFNDFTAKEIEDSWYSDKEYKRIRKEYNTTVQLLSKSNKMDEKKHCVRGLERKTKEGARKRENSKLTSIGAVLREQHRQYLLGLPDPRAIARAYVCETHMAREEARLLAISDEQAVRGEANDSPEYQLDRNIENVARKSFQLKRLLGGSGRIRRGVLEELIALTTGPALKVDPTPRAA